jgi:hypothetical protein
MMTTTTIKQQPLKTDKTQYDVVIPRPVVVDTVWPSRWTEDEIAGAKACGWQVSYMMDSSGNCWWDGDRYSTTPQSLSLPLSAVRDHAPEWFDWSRARRGVLTVNWQWYPTYSSGNLSALNVDEAN